MEEIYEAEAIRSKKIMNNKVYYEIKWKDYSETENTLEPQENLRSVNHMIIEFEKKNFMKKSMNKKDENFVHSKSANSKEFPDDLFNEKKNDFDFFEEKTSKANEFSSLMEKNNNLSLDKEITIQKSLFNNISNDIGEKKNFTEMKSPFERKKKKGGGFLDKILKGSFEIFNEENIQEKSKEAEKMILEDLTFNYQGEEKKIDQLPVQTIFTNNQFVEEQISPNTSDMDKINEKEELIKTIKPLLTIHDFLKETNCEKEKSKSSNFLDDKTTTLDINEKPFLEYLEETQEKYRNEDLIKENQDQKGKSNDSKINSKQKENHLIPVEEKEIYTSINIEKNPQNIEIEEEIKTTHVDDKILEEHILKNNSFNENDESKNKKNILSLPENEEMDQELNEILEEKNKKLKLDDLNSKKVSISKERDQKRKRGEKEEREKIEEYKDDLFKMSAIVLKKKFNITKLPFGNFKFDKLDQINAIFCEKNYDKNKEELPNKKMYAKISWKTRKNGDQMANSIVEYETLKKDYPEVLAEYFFNKFKNKIKEQIS